MSLREKARAYRSRIFPKDASPIRRAGLVAVPTVAAAVVGGVIADRLGVFDPSPQAQLTEVNLGVTPVDHNLQMVGSQIFTLLDQLRQAPGAQVDQYGTITIPDRGITISSQRSPYASKFPNADNTPTNYYNRVKITHLSVVDGNTQSTNIDVIHDPEDGDKVVSVSAATSTYEGVHSLVEVRRLNPTHSEGVGLRLDYHTQKTGTLTEVTRIGPNLDQQTINTFSTDPAENTPIRLSDLTRFNRSVARLRTEIAESKVETINAAEVEAKMTEWQEKLSGLTSNEQKTCSEIRYLVS